MIFHINHLINTFYYFYYQLPSPLQQKPRQEIVCESKLNTLKSLSNLVPINHLKKILNIFRPSILIINIISMLPNINYENRLFFIRTNVHHKIILIRRFVNHELSRLINSKPRPARTKNSRRSLGKFLFKILKVTKVPIY